MQVIKLFLCFCSCCWSLQQTLSGKFSTTIEILLSERHLDIYDTQVESLDNDFSMNVELLKLNRSMLLFIENLHYKNLSKKYPHLQSLVMDNVDTKPPKLPVLPVLGRGEFTRIKTSTCPHMGNVGEPVAELQNLIGPSCHMDKSSTGTTCCLHKNLSRFMKSFVTSMCVQNTIRCKCK